MSATINIDHRTRAVDISRLHGIHRNTVTRILKREIGMTFREIHKRAILKAIREQMPGESVAEFCSRTGIPRSTYYRYRTKIREGRDV